MDKRLMTAMAMYGLLALLAGLTLENAGVRVGGNFVEFRVCVWILLAGLALKTWIAHKAGF
jgi:hypothetical protein